MRFDRLFRLPTGDSKKSLAREDRGAILVEYTAVFAVVTVVLTVSLVKLGPSLMKAWDDTQGTLLASKP
ncbi:MAG TPA: hypothetical protein VGI39_23175 [Polyangiaceae bacterium]